MVTIIHRRYMLLFKWRYFHLWSDIFYHSRSQQGVFCVKGVVIWVNWLQFTCTLGSFHCGCAQKTI